MLVRAGAIKPRRAAGDFRFRQPHVLGETRRSNREPWVSGVRLHTRSVSLDDSVCPYWTRIEILTAEELAETKVRGVTGMKLEVLSST